MHSIVSYLIASIVHDVERNLVLLITSASDLPLRNIELNSVFLFSSLRHGRPYAPL